MVSPSNGLTRRACLASSAAALLATFFTSKACAINAAPIELPADLLRAAKSRRCRIVVQHDAHDVLARYAKRHGNQAPFEPFRDAVFAYADDPLTQIDALWWDVAGASVGAVYPSQVEPPVDHPLLQHWLGQGIDWIAELVAGARKRKLEVFWNQRISEVDGKPEGGLENDHLNPLKAAHPDWVIPVSFWWQGMWNLAAPGLREHKLKILRELAINYDLDGIQIDFARHVPSLPPGRQWEMHEEATEFMRMVRVMTLAVGARRGRPILLAAKVPQTLAGCRIDGFDVAAWAERGLVDVLTLGSRAMEVETERFREALGGRVQLQSCFDDHHATDGYRLAPIEVLRGVFANHWRRGANSVVTFNWATGLPDLCQEIGCEAGSLAQRDAYREAGALATMKRKDKVFALDRRGGYPWAVGFFNRNDNASLPAPMSKTATDFQIHIADAPAAKASLTIRLVLWGAGESDQFEVRLNGALLAESKRDPEWKDAQIFSPRPQPTSGGSGQYEVNPQQRLLRIDHPAPVWREGFNTLTVRCIRANIANAATEARLEKLEAHLSYVSS
jgi:Glycosyl hydrolase-like 10